MSLAYRLWQLRVVLWVAVWTSLCVFISIWTMLGGVALLGAGIALFWWLQTTNRGPFAHRPPKEAPQRVDDDPATREREARFMVTQVLRDLTRVQVAYLCQEFGSDREAAAWLKRSLPRGYRTMLADIQRELDLAREGRGTDATRLARRVLERRDEMLRTIEALERAHKDHPGHALANPVIFVITEHLTADGDEEPEIVTLAGWNPEKAALLPRVDRLNLFSEHDGGRQIRGQAVMKDLAAALKGKLKRVNDEPAIHVIETPKDPVQLGVRLEKVPLGFVIGAAELL